MPNIATHGLLAQEVLDKAPFDVLADVIRRYPKAYFLGSNGPDFLFYYNALPWQNAQGAKRFNRYGNRVHSEKIDAFYHKAVEVIRRFEDRTLQEAAISFLAGHLTHWSLDTVAHPYVFHKTGPIAGETRYWHYRLESNIYILMVKQIKGYSLKDFDAPQLVNADAATRKAVAMLYQPILKEVYDEDVTVEELIECMTSFHKVARLLNDPLTLKFPLVAAIERHFKIEWKFSGHMVIGRMDTTRDILNLKHTSWTHPCDASMVFNDSFIDLYQQAKERATGVLCALNDVLYKHSMPGQLISLIGDRTYDTGLKNPPEMLYFNPIY